MIFESNIREGHFMNFREEWNRIGYNLEELYFERVNRELIHKMKAQNNPTQEHDQSQQRGQIIQFRSRAVTPEKTSTKKAA